MNHVKIKYIDKQIKLMIAAVSMIVVACTKSGGGEESAAPPPAPPPAKTEPPPPPSPDSIIDAGNPLRFRSGVTENTYPRLTDVQLQQLKDIFGNLDLVRIDGLLGVSGSQPRMISGGRKSARDNFQSEFQEKIKRRCEIKPYTFANVSPQLQGGFVPPVQPGNPPAGAPPSGAPGPASPSAPVSGNSGPQGVLTRTVEANIDGYSCPVFYKETLTDEMSSNTPAPAVGALQSGKAMKKQVGASQYEIKDADIVSLAGMQKSWKNWTALGREEMVQGNVTTRVHYQYDGGLDLMKRGQALKVKMIWVTDEGKFVGADHTRSRDLSSTLTLEVRTAQLEVPLMVAYVESYRHYENDRIREEKYFLNGVPISARELTTYLAGF